MATIKLTPDELRDQAKAYQNGYNTITDLLQALSREQENIKANWSGNSFDKFDQQFESLKPKVTDFATLLEDIYNQLNKVAEIIENTDQDIASQIGTI